jgi:hypothetical protein
MRHVEGLEIALCLSSLRSWTRTIASIQTYRQDSIHPQHVRLFGTSGQQSIPFQFYHLEQTLQPSSKSIETILVFNLSSLDENNYRNGVLCSFGIDQPPSRCASPGTFLCTATVQADKTNPRPRVSPSKLLLLSA